MSDVEFPKHRLSPVGVGDSTTVIVDEKAVLQIDPRLPSHNETSNEG